MAEEVADAVVVLRGFGTIEEFFDNRGRGEGLESLVEVKRRTVDPRGCLKLPSPVAWHVRVADAIQEHPGKRYYTEMLAPKD